MSICSKPEIHSYSLTSHSVSKFNLNTTFFKFWKLQKFFFNPTSIRFNKDDRSKPPQPAEPPFEGRGWKSSSLMVKVTSALSREGVSCEASNIHGKKGHVFHFGSGGYPRREQRSRHAGGPDRSADADELETACGAGWVSEAPLPNASIHYPLRSKKVRGSNSKWLSNPSVTHADTCT